MSKILNRSFTFVALVSLAGMLFVDTYAFGQCGVKTSVKNNVKTLTATQYYAFDRTGENYDGISLEASSVTMVAGKPAYKINIVYTSTKTAILQKLILVADSGQISIPLINNGAKYIDNKKYNSNNYRVDVADSIKLFISQHPIKKLSAVDASGQPVMTLTVDDPSFLMQRFVCLQTPVKRKPLPKKTHKIGS